jgi:hypothetical protein
MAHSLTFTTSRFYLTVASFCTFLVIHWVIDSCRLPNFSCREDFGRTARAAGFGVACSAAHVPLVALFAAVYLHFLLS